MQGTNLSSQGGVSNNHEVGNSQSRIKVNLSQQEGEEMTLGHDEPHMIQAKPMLG